jgi:hypothetical protein
MTKLGPPICAVIEQCQQNIKDLKKSMGQDNARPNWDILIPPIVCLQWFFLAAVLLYSFIDNKRQKTLKEIMLI